MTSDGLLGFEVVRQHKITHKVVLAGKGKAGCGKEPFQWLNVILGNLKTCLVETHHAFKFAKYAHRYLAVVQYRFNRRFDLASMVTRFLHAAISTKLCPKPVLQASPAESA